MTPPTDVMVRAAGSPPIFQRPAELVDISERLYQQVFAVGMWVTAGLCAFAAGGSLLQPTADSQFRGLVVCSLYTVACVLVARRPAPVYRALRHQPWWLLGAGVVLGAGAWFVGRHDFQLFLPIIAVIGVAGIAMPPPVVTSAGLIAATGLAAPQLLEGNGNVGGPIAVLVPPLLFWLIVDRIAEFTLRLHQSTAAVASTIPDQSSATATDRKDDVPNAAVPAELPAPPVIVVGNVRLTARQLQAILLLSEGLNHREIGACLEIGAVQVGRHLKKARERAQVATTAELVAWAIGRGLIPPAGLER